MSRMLDNERQRVLGRWMVFCAAVSWGTSATLARHVFEHVPALYVAAIRLTIATTLMLPWLALRRPASLRIPLRDVPYFVILGVFGVAAVQGSYYYAISRLGVGVAIVLQYLAPICIVLFDLMRGRAVGWRMMVAVVLALAGTVLLVGSVDARVLHASAFDFGVGIASAVIFAFYILYSQRGLRRHPPETVLFYSFAVGGICWLSILTPARILATPYSLQTWAMFLALGVFSTLLPFSLLYAGLRRLPATEASVIATTEPVVAIIAARVFLGESLHALQYPGAALVIAAALMASSRGPESQGVVAEPH